MTTTGLTFGWVVAARRITVVMALFAALGVGVFAVPQPAQATASSCDTLPDPLPAGFVSCWRVTAGFSLMLPLFGNPGSNNFDVNWGDGQSTTGITGEAPTHTFTDAGDYWIGVSGTTRPKFTLAPGDISNDMRNSLIRIAQWDGLALADGGQQFAYASNFTTIDNSAGAPDLTGVTSFANAFLTAPSLNANLNSWNVSGVTNMYRTFRDAAVFNGDISDWNVSNVTNMLDMFRDARAFNQPLDSWNTGNVTNMSEMFRDARAFNQPLNSWNTAKVTDMHYMFMDAQAFNQPLDSWNTGSVTDMYSMFGNAQAFNQPLNSWNTGNVRDMATMFRGALAFNQPLNSWNTGNVTDMSSMFRDARAFNQPLNSWDTGNVTKMYGMFRDARAFNQPLDSWNTGNVNDMENMFRDATAFNQPLGGLNVRRLNDGFPNLSQFMSGSNPSGSPPDMTMSALNVDLTLAGWAEQMQGLTGTTRLDLGGSTNLASRAFYTEGSGSVAVAALQAAGWTVTGGNLISTTKSLTPQITETMDSGATRSFSFRLKNGSGVEYTVNPRSVLVATPTLAGASAGAVTYDSAANDGTYTFEYTAPSNVGGAAVSAASAVVDDIVLTVNGQTIVTPIEVTINPAVAPSAPTITSATPGNGSAVVAFTAPTSDGGSAITGYEYRLDGGAWVSVGSTSSPFTITGLTNGTPYQVELRAVNGVGPGPESAPVSVTPAIAGTVKQTWSSNIGAVPLPVTDAATLPYTEGVASQTNLARTFEFPSLSATCSLTYTVTGIPAVGGWGILVYNATTNRVIPLKDNPTWGVLEQNFNNPVGPIDYGPFLGTIGIFKDFGIFTGADPEDHALFVASNSVQPSSGSYSVTAELASTDNGGTPITLADLQNGNIVIALYGINDGPNGPDIVEAITLSAGPCAPPAPTITSATPGNGSAVVAFTAPTSDGGSAIADYEYRLDGGEWVSVGSMSSPFTITGLTNGTPYQVELRAVNGVGPGPESAPVTVTPAAPATTVPPATTAPATTAPATTAPVTTVPPSPTVPPTLPVTGDSSGLVAVWAFVLLVAGAGLFGARRRALTGHVDERNSRFTSG